MSTRANPMIIGAFVVGAVALLLVALLVWGGTGLFRNKLDYVLVFDAAVTGLNKGAPVLARGVKIGEVTDIQLRWGTHGLIAVYVALEPEALKGLAEGGPRRALERAVREDGLRAQLRMQSFVTGVLYVALDVRPGTTIVLRGLDPRVPELPTVPADLEVWTAKLERFADKIEKVPLDQIGQTVAAVLEDAKKILESKETQDLLRNTNATITDARTLVRRVDAQIDPLMAQLKGTLARVDPVATEAEAALKAAQAAIGDVRPVIESLRHVAAKLDAQADPLLTSIRSTSDTARATLEGAQLTLGSVDRTLEQDSPLGFELFETMHELRGAAIALRSLADYLERVPDAPVYGVRRPRAGAR
jgi:phospholipid/cholesterol/gamma-HCH transport system substrate-binding protein